MTPNPLDGRDLLEEARKKVWEAEAYMLQDDERAELFREAGILAQIAQAENVRQIERGLRSMNHQGAFLIQKRGG